MKLLVARSMKSRADLLQPALDGAKYFFDILLAVGVRLPIRAVTENLEPTKHLVGASGCETPKTLLRGFSVAGQVVHSIWNRAILIQ